MKPRGRLILILTLLVFAMVAPLPASNITTASPIPAVDINQVPTDYTGTGIAGCCGYPSDLWAEGWDVSGLGWQFNFTTADPTFFQNICNGYNQIGVCDWGTTVENFGPGGSFTLTGPNGELYTATIVDGWVKFDWYHDPGGGFEGDYRITTYGSWSDGSGDYFGTVKGGIYDDGREPATVQFTPEPAGLVLLGSGILGFAGLLRRKLS